ncbi:MAG: hypothetical protein ABSG52_03925 [Terriglobales bacterium]
MRKPYKQVKTDKPDPVTNQPNLVLPMLSVQIGSGHIFLPAPILAIVDSGSPYCLFRADIAEALKIDLTSGKPAQLGSVRKGALDTYYFHKVKVKIERNWLIEVFAGVSSTMACPAILGRNGFFDQFFVKFDHSTNPPAVEIEKIDKVQ